MIKGIPVRVTLLAAAAGILMVQGCGNEGLPTSVAPSGLKPTYALGDVSLITALNLPVVSEIKICKAGANGVFSVTRVVVNGGVGTTINPANIPVGTCLVVAKDIGGTNVGSNVTITETSAVPSSVTVRRNDAGVVGPVTAIAYPFASPFFLNNFHGYTLTFVNSTPPVVIGNQGCSPGYWKNHTDAGDYPSPYTPNTLFSSVFKDAFPGQTLLEVLNNGGGGLKALGRQTVSALLNAQKLGAANYGLSAAQVINAFNAVYPNGDYETLKNRFAALTDVNGRVCPLN